ncbi:MAG: hypothetical protein ABSA50_10475 [Candidatus Bathyarchaeia archaeon]
MRQRIRDFWITLRVHRIAWALTLGSLWILYSWIIAEWFYRHGITRRSIRYFVHRLANVLLWLIGGLVVLLVLAYGPSYVYELVRSWVAENLVNPAQFFTEALVLLIVELPILYLVSRVAGESKSPVARLQVNASRPTENKDGSLILGVNVTNVGEVAAVSCEARLTFELKSGDLVDSTTDTVFTRDTFKPPLRTKVPWNNATLYTHLRVGDLGEIPVVKVSLDSEHFEIPSDQGWTPISLSVRPDHYFGSVNVVPFNGRPTLTRFVLRQVEIPDRYGRPTGLLRWGVQLL